jgi:hypothetical protein
MAVQASVTNNSTAYNFYAFSDTSESRFFLNLNLSGPTYDNKRFHAPGWSGNALIRAGFTGQVLTLRVRYQGILATVFALYKADATAFGARNNSISDGANTWSRCTLLTAERQGDEKSQGATTTKFFEVKYTFQIEQE